jgi:AcrR family transcriptional regulator
MDFTASKRETKATAILAAAAHVFARRGLRASTMAEIARAAGVAKGTLYLYHSSKQELFLAVFEGLFRQLTARMQERLGEGGEQRAADQLRGLVADVFAWDDRFLELLPLWLEFWAAGASGDLREVMATSLREIYDEMLTLVGGLIARGQATGEFRVDLDPRAHAAVLLGAIDGLFLQAMFKVSADPRAALEDFLESALRGMRTAPSDGESA